MYTNAEKWCKTCPKCQKVNMPAGQAHQGKMHTMGADYPGQVWVVDTLMVHEMHTREKYLMAGTDQFTKS